MKIGSLFTGTGALDQAAEQYYNAETVWRSDNDPGARKIIAHHWPDAPNLGDITTVDWAAIEPVDILTGGFPCQDVSAAGKRAGMKPGTRSGLWTHMAYAIAQLRPRYVIAENVRGLLSASADSDVEPCPWCVGGAESGEPDLRALGAVLGDLAQLGYDARWIGLRAADVGAPHGRFRVFVAAWDAAGGHGRGSAGGLCPSSQQGSARGSIDRIATDAECGGWDGGAGQLRPGRRLEPADGGGAPDDSSGDGRHERWPESARHVGGPDATQRSAGPPTDAEGDPWRITHRNDGATADADGGRLRTLKRHLRPRESDAQRSATADPDSDGFTDERRCRGIVEPDPDRRDHPQEETTWGPYESAIRRWESVLRRPAPAPTEPGAKGGQRLSPRFVEWMMGAPAGHVTDVPGLSRNDQLKALGNSVVPQQAYAALTLAGSR